MAAELVERIRTISVQAAIHYLAPVHVGIVTIQNSKETMEQTTILTILQVALIPITLAAVNWYIQRNVQKNALEIAQINSQAEQREAAANWSEKVAGIATDMLAPMEAQLRLVTAENIKLVGLQQQLKSDMNAEQARHNKAEAEQKRRIDEQATEIEKLKKKINALEIVDLQRTGEIDELKKENGRLRAKIDGIKEQIDTKPLLQKKDTQS